MSAEKPTDPAAAEPERRWLVLLAASIGLFVVLSGTTSANIAVPGMISSLGTGLGHVEWALNAYAFVFASLLIAFGRLGDIVGRRRLFLIGLGIFGVGAAACGVARSVDVVAAARVVQAIGAAAIVPMTLSLTAVSFPADDHDRRTAFGIWGAVAGFALGTGSALGGLLSRYNWRFAFLIDVPIVLFAIWFTFAVVHESREPGPHKIDWFGVVLSVLLVGSFTYAIAEGSSRHWGWGLVGSTAAALWLLAVLVLWERQAAEPLVDLRLFRSRTFSAGTVVAGLLLFCLIGILSVVPLFLQTVLRFGPLLTGLALVPMSFAVLVVGAIAGSVSGRVGPRWLVVVGMAVVGLGAWLVATSGGVADPGLAWRLILIGAGLGLAISPLTGAVMEAATSTRIGNSSGTLATAMQIGVVAGVVVLGAVLQGSLATSFAHQLTVTARLAAPVVRQTVSAEQRNRMGLTGSGADAQSRLLRHAASLRAADFAAPALAEALVSAPTEIRAAVPTDKLAEFGAQSAKALVAGSALPQARGVDNAAALASFQDLVVAAISRRVAALEKQLAKAYLNAFVQSTSKVFEVVSLMALLGALVSLLVANKPTARAPSGPGRD